MIILFFNVLRKMFAAIKKKIGGGGVKGAVATCLFKENIFLSSHFRYLVNNILI